MKKYFILSLIIFATVSYAINAGGQGTAINRTYALAQHLDHEFHGRQWLMHADQTPSGTSFADTLSLGFYPFTVTAAADSNFGTAIQIIGSDDTPIISGNKIFHMHAIMVTAVNSNSLYKMRIAWGASNAAGVAAGDYQDLWLFGDDTNPQQVSPTSTRAGMRTIDVGTSVWVSIANAAGAQTMDFVFTIIPED